MTEDPFLQFVETKTPNFIMMRKEKITNIGFKGIQGEKHGMGVQITKVIT